MEILQHLIGILPDKPIPVKQVVIGVHWTLVCSKYCGLASTMVNQEQHGQSRVRDVGFLEEKTAQELAQLIFSSNLLEASIGIAAVNSLIEVDNEQLVQVNASEVIERNSAGKNLVVVGHFPFVERMKGIAKNCWVIEKRLFGDDFPEESACEYIPKADVVAITGTSLINHTIESLLSLCPANALVMILGPSTPLTPVFYDYGVSFLSGSRVEDETMAKITIQQGANFQQVKGVRLVTMERPKGVC